MTFEGAYKLTLAAIKIIGAVEDWTCPATQADLL